MATRPVDWEFTSEGFPEVMRAQAWREALGTMGVQPSIVDAGPAFHGMILLRASPRGIAFARLASSPQQLLHPARRNHGDVLLSLHLDGEGWLAMDGRKVPLRPGDLVTGPATNAFQLSFTTAFRQVLVLVPQAVLNTRLIDPRSLRTVHLSGAQSSGAVFSGLLRSIADAMELLGPDELRPVDMALPGFLETILGAGTVADRPGAATSGQAALVQRIFQTVEGRLGDADLAPGGIADTEGISSRYLQKLFEASGENFTNYVRRRRLERARDDLANPHYAHLSISDICFRWGFNDAAHFSRSFRDQFGVSPRTYRQAIRDAPAQDARPPRQRGRPKEVPIPPAGRTPVRQAGDASWVAAEKAVQAYASGAHRLLATPDTVHWGYFNRDQPPVLTVASGDTVMVEAVTQHAYDDYDRMIKGDPALEQVFHWTADRKTIDRRGAGPMDASIYGRGAGEGFGVHILTGPIAVAGARPGDVIEVEILDVLPRPSQNPAYLGRCFGSNAAAWWGYHHKEQITEPRDREVVTIYEFDLGKTRPCACAVYNYRWTPQTDPFGVVHPTIDYPGIPVDRGSIQENHGVLPGITVPVRPHFGVIGLAPREAGFIDSVPPAYFGGNLDNWRLGKGARVYLPVSVAGGLLSVGDPHASQGDSELCGTAIECSLTGVFRLTLHRRADQAGRVFADLSYPLIETAEEWILMGFSLPNYLAELGDKAQSEIYKKSSLDLAMKDAFRKMRRFLMTVKGLSEDEAISLMSVAVDFGVSQVVDGNWGVHAILRKELFGAAP